jgi:hypothetical protein
MARVKQLSLLTDEIEDTRLKQIVQQGENYSLKRLMDFIRLNFGSIEWEMEGFKRKIMISKPPEPTQLPFSRSTSVVEPSSFETIAAITQ